MPSPREHAEAIGPERVVLVANSRARGRHVARARSSALSLTVLTALGTTVYCVAYYLHVASALQWSSLPPTVHPAVSPAAGLEIHLGALRQAGSSVNTTYVRRQA